MNEAITGSSPTLTTAQQKVAQILVKNETTIKEIATTILTALKEHDPSSPANLELLAEKPEDVDASTVYPVMLADPAEGHVDATAWRAALQMDPDSALTLKPEDLDGAPPAYLNKLFFRALGRVKDGMDLNKEPGKNLGMQLVEFTYKADAFMVHYKLPDADFAACEANAKAEAEAERKEEETSHFDDKSLPPEEPETKVGAPGPAGTTPPESQPDPEPRPKPGSLTKEQKAWKKIMGSKDVPFTREISQTRRVAKTAIKLTDYARANQIDDPSTVLATDKSMKQFCKETETDVGSAKQLKKVMGELGPYPG